jgi:hypothetical protein
MRSVPLRKRFVVDDFTPRGIAVSPDDRTLAVTQSDGSVDLLDRGRSSDEAACPAAVVQRSRWTSATTGGSWRSGVSTGGSRSGTLAPMGRLAGLRYWTQAVAFSPTGGCSPPAT